MNSDLRPDLSFADSRALAAAVGKRGTVNLTEAQLWDEIRRLEAVNNRLIEHAENLQRMLDDALDQGARLAALLEASSRTDDTPPRTAD